MLVLQQAPRVQCPPFPFYRPLEGCSRQVTTRPGQKPMLAAGHAVLTQSVF